MAIGTRKLVVEVVGDTRNLERSFKRASTATRGFKQDTDKFVRGVTAGTLSVRGLGRSLAFTSTAFLGGAGLGAAFAATIKSAADFESQLNVLKVVSGATASQMKQVGKTARDLGNDIHIPGASAADAATAMLELAKGGLSVSQAMKAARGTLQLAAAAQLSQADAANIQVAALNAFKLKGQEAGHVADVLAGAANAAQGEISDFAFAMQQVASQAHSIGFTIDETATAITALTKAGVRGSDAGTSLRVMFQRLNPQTAKAAAEMKRLNVTAFDQHGRFLPLRQIIEQYHAALSKLTPRVRQHALQVLFGTDAQRAANIIFGQSVQQFDALEKKVTKSGQAAQLSNARMKGFNGAMEALRNAVQTLQINIGSALLPELTKYVNKAAAWASDSKNQAKIQKEVVGAVHDVVGAMKLAAAVFTQVKDAVQPVVDAVGGLKNALELLLGLKVASVLAGWSGGFRGLGASAGTTGAAGEVGVLQGSLTALANGGPYIATLIIAEKTIKDPKGQIGGRLKSLFDNIHVADSLFSAAPGAGQILHAVAPFVDAQKRRQAEKDARRKDLQTPGPISRPDKDRAAERGVVNPVRTRGQNARGGAAVHVPHLDPPKPPKGITAEQRNKWFDAAIGRKIDRVQDIGNLRGQVGALTQIGALIQERIGATKDITRKLNLEDQLVQVHRQRKGVLDQIAESFKQKATDAKQKATEARQKANEIKKHMRDIVDSAKRAANEAADAQRQAFGALFSGPVLNPSEQDRKRMLGVPGVTADKLLKDITAQNQRFASMQRMLGKLRKRGASGALIGELSAQGVEGLPQISALAKAPKGVLQAFFNQARIRDRQVNRAAAVEQKITINIHGGDEKKVAQEVLRLLQKRAGKQVAQTRGRYGGKSLGLH